MQGGAVVALVSDAGMPLVSDPGYVLVQGCVAAGLEVEVLPGPSAALAALVASALPRTCGASSASCRASARRWSRCSASARDASSRSSRRSGWRRRSRCWRSSIPARPVAVCRELTKLHEEVVRGTAGELAARYAEAEPRGEVVLVVGGAPPRTGVDEAAVDAVRRLVEAGAKPRVAAGVVAELTGAPANALYKAVAEK